jgi:sugar/nucleoside kinase (ribokinase family)
VNDAPNRRVVAVGQIARDLVLKMAVIPEQGNSGPVTERQEMLGGKGANLGRGPRRRPRSRTTDRVLYSQR